MKKIITFFLDMIFPIRCVMCRVFDYAVCDDCFSSRKKEREVGFQHTDDYLDGVLVLYEYTDLVQRSIHEYKYLYIHAFAYVWEHLITQRLGYIFSVLPGSASLLPVPLHRKRFVERGFNQCDILVQALVKGGNYTSLPPVLMRTKYTQKQSHLGRSQRLANIKGAFKVRKKFQSEVPETIVLIDDVYTTGATVRECARVLKEHGVKSVYAVVLTQNRFE